MPEPAEIDVRATKVIESLIKSFLSNLNPASGPIITSVIDVLSAKMPMPGVVDWDKFCDNIVKQGRIDQPTADMLKTLKDEVAYVRWVVFLVVKILLWIKDFSSAMDVYNVDRTYNLMSKAVPNPAPVEALVGSMMIDPARASENRAQMKRFGYNETQIDNIILSAYRKVEEGTIATLYLRGHYTADKMYERMRELGYTDTRIQEIVKTWQLYPGPQDLFTMVAHEAFEPDIYGPMGLDDEFPSEQIPWLEAQGISKEWAMKYWISHWEQPSLGQGFEMLHRGVITRGELDMLFRVVEIPKFWRDKLMAITFNPYTRVDVRRMHDLGVLNTQELVQAYQDLGYEAAKAVKMAEFTLRYNEQGKNDLTRGAILTSYHDDLISRSDAKSLLTSLKISDDSAEYWLDLEDYKITAETTRIYVDTIKERYLLGVDNETVTRGSLNKIGLRGSKIDALIDNWRVDVYKYQALPSKGELSDMLASRVISEGKWREIMTRQGYSAEHQTWYLKLLERTVTVSQTMPSRTDLTTWLKKEIISENEFRTYMRLLGYSDTFIQHYLDSM